MASILGHEFLLEQLNTIANFDQLALDIFNYQSINCEPYCQYLKHLKIDPIHVKSINEIPFLPIQTFKNQKVISGKFEPKRIYKSSGTTGQNTSQHFVKNIELYKKNAIKIFENEFGSLKNYCILALLPSYLEQGNSSLVAMVQYFIEQSESEQSKFYGTDYSIFIDDFNKVNNNLGSRKILIWGVSYALLDILDKVECLKFDPKNIVIIETGGMKGRRKEMLKEELHKVLCDGFGVENICSEYGMTELLSQCYSRANGIFKSTATMQILLREVSDPFAILPKNSKKTGGINVIDLANLYSCSFIETQDLGQYQTENTFKLLGRFDNADIRGCNLLIQ